MPLESYVLPRQSLVKNGWESRVPLQPAHWALADRLARILYYSERRRELAAQGVAVEKDDVRQLCWIGLLMAGASFRPELQNDFELHCRCTIRHFVWDSWRYLWVRCRKPSVLGWHDHHQIYRAVSERQKLDRLRLEKHDLVTAYHSRLASWRERLVLVLRYHEHFSYLEIADVLSLSYSMVRTLHWKATIHLRKMLAADDLVSSDFQD